MLRLSPAQRGSEYMYQYSQLPKFWEGLLFEPSQNGCLHDYFQAYTYT